MFMYVYQESDLSCMSILRICISMWVKMVMRDSQEGYMEHNARAKLGFSQIVEGSTQNGCLFSVPMHGNFRTIHDRSGYVHTDSIGQTLIARV